MRLRIYLQGGNIIEVDGIEDVNYSYQGNTITHLSIEYSKEIESTRRLLVPFLDFSQIQALDLIDNDV